MTLGFYADIKMTGSPAAPPRPVASETPMAVVA
jgi:hypothetical protein